jgi:lipopolysaccharide transport system permease protein
MSLTVIDARRPGLSRGLAELYPYRDLFLVLAYRDLRVRYAQTFLGLLWAFLQPAATLLVFAVVFGQALRVDTGGSPYPLFALAGIVPWTYFSFVVSSASSSIIGAQDMIRKVYFPRIIIPLSKAVVGFVDLLITLVFFAGLMAYYGRVPGTPVVYLPAFLLAAVVVSLAAGIWLSALSVRFRDVQHVVPFLVQVGMYATPIAYPGHLVPERFLSAYHLNPMAGIVEGVRWSLLGGAPPSHHSYVSLAAAAVLLLSALLYFRRVERSMADVV